MKRENKKQTAGFSLIEVIVAIAILGMVTIPLGGGLVLSHRLNARSEQMIQARLAVTNAVEALMAEGVKAEADYSGGSRFSDVTVEVSAPEPGEEAYLVTVMSSTVDTVFAKTYIRPAPSSTPEAGGGAAE